jgi:hypothetical protein
MSAATKERRYAVTLLLVSLAILALGTLIRRRAAEPKPAPPTLDLEILQRLTADRRLRDLSGYLAERAELAARRIAAAGLVWDGQTVLTPPASGDRPFTVRRETVPTNLPAVVPVRPGPGDWVLAVARDRGGRPVFAHGLYEGTTRERCGSFEYDAVHSAAPLAPSMIGGGLFLIDGGLAAFVAGCNGSPIAIASSSIAEILAHPPSPADRIEERYGFRRDEKGLVTAVWDGTDAQRAGLLPGDVVDPAGDPPNQAERGRRTVKLEWPEEPAGPLPTPRGLTFDGRTVAAVVAGSSASAAGIRAGDVVTRIAGKSLANPADAIQQAKGPVTITIERDGRRRETLLQP